MKDFFIFLIGTLFLSPIVVFGLSGSFLGFVIASFWVIGIYGTTQWFPRFWKKCWRINMYYVNILEGK